MHQALFARIEAQDRPAGIAAHILGVSPGGTRHLPALFGLELDVVDDRADRHLLERHGVARLDVGALHRGDHLVARGKTLRRKDVGLLAVLVGDEGDERGPVGIVFEPFDRADDVELGPLEIDQTIAALVPAAAIEGGDAAAVVAPAGLGQPFGQLLDGLALLQLGPVDADQLTAAGRGRIVLLECHCSVLPLPRGPSRCRWSGRRPGSRRPS